MGGGTKAEDEGGEEGMRVEEEEGTEGKGVAEVCAGWVATGTVLASADEGVFGVVVTLSELFVADVGVCVRAEDRVDVVGVFAASVLVDARGGA